MYYHYTSFETFLKILNDIKTFNGEKFLELYATRIDKVNDPTELEISKTQFVELLTIYEEIHCICQSKSIAEQVASIDESEFRRMCDSERKGHAPYITCFSKMEDFIPMWSLYGDKGHGVCLCFTDDIGSECFVERGRIVLFGDVAYSNYVESNSIRRVLELYYGIINDECNDSMENIIRDMYLGMSPFIKNDAYKYENEYRVCVYNYSVGKCGTFYNCDKGYISLYVPLKALQKVVWGTKLPKGITESLIKQYFEKEKYNIKIERSEIPFR